MGLSETRDFVSAHHFPGAYILFQTDLSICFLSLFYIKTFCMVVLGSLKDAFRRLLFSPDGCDIPLPSSDLESGVSGDQGNRLPSTTLIQVFFETLLGSRYLTSSSKYAYDGLVMPLPTRNQTLFVDLLSLKMEHRLKMMSTGQRHVPIPSGNTRPKDRTYLTGRQLGRYPSPPETRGDNFRKWTLVMRTLFASRSALEGGYTPQFPPGLSHIRGVRHHHANTLPSRSRSFRFFPSIESDMARTSSLKSRIPRPKTGARRHVRSMDRNVVYGFNKIPLPLPFPTPLPHPPAPPPSPTRHRSVSDAVRSRAFPGVTSYSVCYPVIRLPEGGL